MEQPFTDYLISVVRSYSVCLWKLENNYWYDTLEDDRQYYHKEIAKLLQCTHDSLDGVLHNFPRDDDGRGFHVARATGMLLSLKEKGLLIDA